MKSTVLKLTLCAAAFALLAASTAIAQEMSIVVKSTQDNPYHTPARLVYIDWFNEPVEAQYFLITQTPDTPGPGESWQEDMVVSQHTITGDDVKVTLYAWAADADKNVIGGSATDWIFYSENVPAISVTQDDFTAQAHSIGAMWETDVDAVGWLEYRIYDPADPDSIPYTRSSISSTEYNTLHDVVIAGLYDQTTYQLRVHSNAVSVDTLGGQPITVTTLAADPIHNTNLTWSGAAQHNLRWSLGSNWVNNRPPTLDTSGVLTFGATGSAAGQVTSILNPQGIDAEADTWQIGGLTVGSGANHKLELDGKKLKVLGAINQTTSGAWMRYSGGGTLQIGESGSAQNLTVRGAMVMEPGTTLAANINNISILNSGNGDKPETYNNTLDLRGVTIQGGVLSLASLSIRGGHRVYISTYNFDDPASLQMDNTTGIETLEVLGDFNIAHMSECGGRIGMYNTSKGEWELPAGLNVNVGIAPVDEEGLPTRGNLTIGCKSADNTACGRLIAGNDGTFNAWLTDLNVGRATASGSVRSYARGILDLRTMNTVLIDAVNARIGANTNTGRTVQGTVRLGAGHYARADYVTVGSPVKITIAGVTSLGRIELYGADLAIDKTLDINTTGRITVNVGTQPSGIHLAESVEPAILGEGKIIINFNNEPTHGDTHWGLRWKGNKNALLGALLAGSGFETHVVFEEGLDEQDRNYKVAVAYNNGYTYVALVDKDAPELPAVTARPLTIDMFPGMPYELSVSDVYATIYNPSEHEETGRTISSPLYQGGDEVQTITFPTPGELPASYDFTLTVYFEGGIQAADTSTITFVTPDPTQDAVTWSGGAEPDLRWSRGMNWQGGRMPVLDSTAQVTFGMSGSGSGVTSILSPQIVDPDADTWQIGALSIAAVVEHALDLDGNTLKVLGAVNQAESGTSMTYTGGGTLQIGEPGNTRNLTVRGAMTMEPGTTLIPNINNLSILNSLDGTSLQTQNTTLDLRGVDIEGGVLSLANLTILGGYREYLASPFQMVWHSTKPAIMRIDDATGLHTFEVSGDLYLGRGADGAGRIGEWDTVLGEYVLPAGLNVKVGTAPDGEDPAIRGNLSLGVRTSTNNGDGRLVAGDGGTFSAWLTDLYVGCAMGSNSGDRWHGNGMLDLKTMDTAAIDAVNVYIGTNSTEQRFVQGTVRLGSGHTARADYVTVGSPVVYVIGDYPSFGKLELYHAVMKVDGTLNVNATGSITVNVGSISSGLDLAIDETDLTIDEGGLITIKFLELPAGGTTTPHYGLKWSGDRKTKLETMIAAGQILTDTSALPPLPEGGYDVVVEFDGTDTYVALEATLPDYSTYAFSYDVPEPVYVNTDTPVAVTFATVEEGTVEYGNVRFAFEAGGPGSVTFKVTGDDETEHTFTNAGNWPPEAEGFELPLMYNETTDWTLAFSETGDYTITFRCYVVEEDELGDPVEGATIATESVQVSVIQTPLYGDADRDGKVDLLDLVFVRNRLFCEDIDEGDNRQADINNDGFVDLEDLIEVRNNLGAAQE